MWLYGHKQHERWEKSARQQNAACGCSRRHWLSIIFRYAISRLRHDTDIFYVLEGSATFVTGGKAVEPKTVSAGEIRGKEIVRGESRRLTKGDIIVIPKGVPHWFKEVNGTFVYYVVKVSK